MISVADGDTFGDSSAVSASAIARFRSDSRFALDTEDTILEANGEVVALKAREVTITAYSRRSRRHEGSCRAVLAVVDRALQQAGRSARIRAVRHWRLESSRSERPRLSSIISRCVCAKSRIIVSKGSLLCVITP